MPCENVSQWTGQRNEGESTTNGEPLAVGSVCNLYDSREEKKYAGYGIGTQSRNLDREVQQSFGKFQGQEPTCKANQAPTLCPPEPP
jgi:hypothetical protein